MNGCECAGRTESLPGIRVSSHSCLAKLFVLVGPTFFGASHMFSGSVPEKLIQSRTGHRSLEALRLYERPSHEQQQAVSNILTSGAETREFGKELTNVTASNVQPITSKSQYRHQSQHATGGRFPAVPAFPGSLFGSMTNCSLTISPQNVVVNINPIPTQRDADLVEQEFDELVQDLHY